MEFLAFQESSFLHLSQNHFAKQMLESPRLCTLSQSFSANAIIYFFPRDFLYSEMTSLVIPVIINLP
jgi:hypothetical protein